MVSPPSHGSRIQRLFGTPARKFYRIIPGLGIASAIMVFSHFLTGWLGQVILRAQGIDPTGKGSPISGITLAVLIGFGVTNLLRSRATFKPGFDFAIKKVLRLGIILVGLKLSFLDILRLGEWGIPVVATVIVTALVLAAVMARVLGVSDRLGTLTAAATGICGITAAVATAPVIHAEDQEVAYTVANVTLFGLLAMIFYPYLGHYLFGTSSAAAGLFLGTGIHDTSQVLGAAMGYKEIFGDELAFQMATITKLTRNVFLVAVVPVLGYLYARRQGFERTRVRISCLFPMFVLGFLAMAFIRSLGEASLASTGQALWLFGSSTWKTITVTAGERWSYYLLGTALAAVGLNTNLKTFKGLGLNPFILGALVAVLVAGLGLGLASVFGPFVGG